MTNDARKTSQLPITTSVSANDRLVVLTNPSTSAQTQTVTIRTLSNTIVRANTTTFGTVKVGENLNVDINGFLNANSGSNGVYPITYVRNNTQYTVANTDVLVFVDPNSVDANVRIILPTTNVANGQEFFIKNLDPGANHIVKVTTQAGIDSGANYVEDHVDGAFKVNIDLGVKGESHTWIWDGTVYRHVAQNNPEPVFYSSTNSYHQVTIVNPSTANNASADWVAYNNEGDYKTGNGPFVDMGVTSNNYSDTTYGNVWGPSDAYLYNYGGNLIVGPQTDHSIKFIAGNTNAADVKFVINTTAVFVNTNIKFESNYSTIRNASPDTYSYVEQYYNPTNSGGAWGSYVERDVNSNTTYSWIETGLTNLDEPYFFIETQAQNSNNINRWTFANGGFSTPANAIYVGTTMGPTIVANTSLFVMSTYDDGSNNTYEQVALGYPAYYGISTSSSANTGNNSNVQLYLDSDANTATIQISNNSVNQYWVFDQAGGLTFPDNSTQNTAYKRTTGSWTVATGSATYSFTVPQNGTYTMWVEANIPNGIIVWNATATVTNTNVPVIGQQFAWNYTGGGTPIEFTAIPTQFIGTVGSIVSSNPNVGTTSDKFDFIINNTSGSEQTVYWGYITQ